jgi:hypothetical protein
MNDQYTVTGILRNLGGMATMTDGNPLNKNVSLNKQLQDINPQTLTKNDVADYHSGVHNFGLKHF